MDLLNLSRPWDCQIFPKSKTICYGGGGGGGGSIPTPKITVPKITTPKIVTPKITVPKIKIPTSTKDLIEGASTTIESVKKDVSEGIEKKKTLISEGIEQVKTEGSKIIEDTKTQVGTETEKLKKGDFSLKNAIQGTVSGASKTFKESDANKIVKKIAKETGYTGSDADTALQKVEKETSNVVNQTLDFVDSPAKVIQAAGERASDFVESVKKDLTDTVDAYGNVIKNIGETGEKIGKIATDTFNTGMNVSTALGSNLAKQVMKARSDLSSAMGGITGGMEEETSSRADLLERDREKRRGGLSRSGTSRTLITGKY